MSRNSVLLAAALLIMMTALASAGEPGSSGFTFLRLGNGARAGGMGEAFTAVADDATSIYWNPAGLAAVEEVELNLTHTEWLMDIRFEQATVANEMWGGVAGLSFTGLYYGSLDRYGEYPSLTPDGTFSPYDLALSLGYARDIIPNLALGAAFKIIYSKIDFKSATGYAFDFGVTHRTKIEGLILAASMLNLGPQASFDKEKFYPPFQLRLGGAYEIRKEALHGGLILAADAVFPNDNDVMTHFGLEYSYQRMLMVRLGYKSGYNVQGATMGAGIAWESLRFDYVYMPIDYDLGDAHRISLTVSPSL
ncbi:MAG: PorV/PorQ family protein [Candidatus Krumholzibacteria bacterium]|nr:PorV/PorQ family protein [Candidatus Krumholzibacteria bacterium]